MVNQFYCVNLWYDIEYESQTGVMQQYYNVIEKINLKVWAKRSKYKTMQKTTSNEDSGVTSATCKYSGT